MTTDAIGLDELIRRHQDRTGESYAQIARRAGLSKAKVGQLALPTAPHMPRADTLRKLATGLQLTFERVQDAAMVTAGVSPDTHAESQRMSLLIDNLLQLDEDDLERVEVIVDALRGRRG